MFACIMLSAVALLFFLFGWRIWRHHEMKWIHDYHCKRVKPEDVTAYTTRFGQGIVVIGAGCLAAGIICLFTGWGWALFTAGFIAGCAWIVGAQKKYNQGIF